MLVFEARTLKDSCLSWTPNFFWKYLKIFWTWSKSVTLTSQNSVAVSIVFTVLFIRFRKPPSEGSFRLLVSRFLCSEHFPVSQLRMLDIVTCVTVMLRSPRDSVDIRCIRQCFPRILMVVQCCRQVIPLTPTTGSVRRLRHQISWFCLSPYKTHWIWALPLQDLH